MDRGLRQEYPPKGNYSARRVVPADVRGVAGLGSELIRSLETNDLRLARRRLPDVMAEFDARIDTARKGNGARLPTIIDVQDNLGSWRVWEIANIVGPGVVYSFDASYETLGIDTSQAALGAMMQHARDFFAANPDESRAIAMPQATAVLIGRLEATLRDPAAWVEVPGFERQMDETISGCGAQEERQVDLADVAPIGASFEGRERFVTIEASGVDGPVPGWLREQARQHFASSWLEVVRAREWARSRAATLLAAASAITAGPSSLALPTERSTYTPRHGDRTVREVIDSFKAARLAGAGEVRRFVYVFESLEEVVGSHHPLRAVIKADIQSVVELLAQIPTNVSKRWPKMGLVDAIAAADTAADEIERLAPKTVKVYASSMRAFFKWSIEQGWADLNPCDGLRLEAQQRVKRRPFTNEEVERLFASLKPFQAARPERWWMPALALYTGARQNELAQLEVADVQSIDGVHCLNLSEFGADGVRTKSKRLKTAASDRLVPLHPDLIDAGFLLHVEARRDNGEPRVFDLPEGPAGGRAHAYSKDFGRHLRRIGITDRGACFHSTRHLWRELAERAGLTDRQIDAIGGWQPVGQSAKYGRRTVLDVIAPLIANISVGDFRLSDLTAGDGTTSPPPLPSVSFAV